MRKIFILSFGLVILLLIGCDKIVETTGDLGSLEIYNAVEKEAFSDEYVLDSVPLMTIDDIESYDWNKNFIKLKPSVLPESNVEDTEKQKTSQNIKIGGSRIFDTNSRDQFMIIVNDELIYSGYYNQSFYSSFFPVGSVMVDSEEGVYINFVSVEGLDLEDLRNDERIYDVLKAYDLLVE